MSGEGEHLTVGFRDGGVFRAAVFAGFGLTFGIMGAVGTAAGVHLALKWLFS